MSRDSTSLKKSSGDCLKLAKQIYSALSEIKDLRKCTFSKIFGEMMPFLNYCIFSGSAEALDRCGGKL